MSDRLADRLNRPADPWRGFSLIEALQRMADPVADPMVDPTLRMALDSLSGGHVERGRGIGVPLHVLARDLVAGTAAAGGSTIGGPRIEPTNAMRGFSVLAEAGVTVVNVPRTGPVGASLGLPGLPFISAPAVAAWLGAEGDAAAESEPTFGLRQADPKTIGVRANVSRKLLKMGGPLADQMVRRDQLDAIGRGLDKAILAGTGADGQPSGLGTVAGTVSMSGTSLSFATIADGIRQVLAAGARMSSLRFIVGTQTFEVLSTRERAAGSGFIIEAGQLAGIPVSVSAEAPTDALYLGDWSRIVVPIYGAIEVFTNPFVSPQSGTVQVHVLADVDVLIPLPGAFLKAASVT